MKIFLSHSFGLACNISAAATSSFRVSTPERRHQQRPDRRSAPQNRMLLWDGATDTAPLGRMLQAASKQAGTLPGSRAADGGGSSGKKIIYFAICRSSRWRVAAAEIRGLMAMAQPFLCKILHYLSRASFNLNPRFRGRHFNFELPIDTRWEKSFQNVWHGLDSGSVGWSEHPNFQQEEWTSSVFFILTLVSSHLSLPESRYHR